MSWDGWARSAGNFVSGWFGGSNEAVLKQKVELAKQEVKKLEIQKEIEEIRCKKEIKIREYDLKMKQLDIFVPGRKPQEKTDDAGTAHHFQNRSNSNLLQLRLGDRNKHFVLPAPSLRILPRVMNNFEANLNKAFEIECFEPIKPSTDLLQILQKNGK